MYSPVSREVKALLSELRLDPAPTIIDVDLRDDAEVLSALLRRLVEPADDFPFLIVGGQYVGSMETIRSLHRSGQLRDMITAAGAVIDGTKKKHKRK